MYAKNEIEENVPERFSFFEVQCGESGWKTRKMRMRSAFSIVSKTEN